MQDIQPVTGWALNYIVALDVYAPGTAGEFLRASAERRQVIAALLSTKRLPHDRHDASKLAEFIGRADHRSILVEAFGSVPDGLRGALARSGSQPHRYGYYRPLFDVLSRGGVVARTIRQLPAIDDDRLLIAKRLPEDICTVSLVQIVAGSKMASDISSLVSLLTSNGIDRLALAQALKRIDSPDQLAELWQRWSLKCEFPAQPVQRSEAYRPVSSGEELRDIALRYRNCALRYLHEALAGEVAFGEFLDRDIGVVVHLRLHHETWVVEGVFGKENGFVPATTKSAVTEFLAAQSAVTVTRDARGSNPWQVLHRLTRQHTFRVEYGW